MNELKQTAPQPWDVIASVHFESTARGGRKTPTPADKFGCILQIDGLSLDVRLQLQTIGPILPGQDVRVPIKFLSPDVALTHCSVGKPFLLRELGIIGQGIIEQSALPAAGFSASPTVRSA